MNPRLYNRFQPAPDGYAQFVPKGEFPWYSETGDGLIQVVDDEAIEKIFNNLPDELFIDKEHLSERPEHGDAMGWGYPEQAQIRADGLYIKPKWSDLGLANISGGRVRYISPVFDPATIEPLGIDEHTGLPRYRVTRMLEAGLTNKPNMRGIKPISNRKPGGPGGEQPGRPNPAATTKENQTMKLINRALKLAPDASEESAVAALEALQNTAAKVPDLEKEITDLKNRNQTLLAAQVEADLEKFADRITDETKPKWQAALLANRESTIELLEGIKPVEEKKDKREALTNRHPAKTPGAQPGSEGDEKKAAAKAAAIRNRASEIQRTEKISFGQAFRRAEAELGKE